MTTDHYDDHAPAANAHDNSDGFLDGGRHTARAVRCLWDTAKSGGLCLALILRVVDGEQAGKEVRGRLYFDTDQADKNGRTAADRSLEALRAMGLKGEVDTIPEGEVDGVLDQGDVELVMKINDAGYPEAKYINPPRTGQTLKAFAPPPVDAKKAFFAQMKARAAAAGASAKATGATPVQRPAPTQQRPAPTPQRGPVTSQAYDPMEGGGEEIPF